MEMAVLALLLVAVLAGLTARHVRRLRRAAEQPTDMLRAGDSGGTSEHDAARRAVGRNSWMLPPGGGTGGF